MISRVRQIPVGQNPEDVMRDLVGDRDVVWSNHQQVMDYLYETMEKVPDIEGIIGYSEGAAIAATLILDEQRRFEETGRERRIKCAMFVTGWPPIDPAEGVILADESELMVDVPTLHVVGANGTVPSLPIYGLLWREANGSLSGRSFPARRIRLVQCLRSGHGGLLRHGQETHDPAIRDGHY